jgi:hypothetical protein
MRLWYAPGVSESDARIEAERCWAGSRNGAGRGAIGDVNGLERNEEASRRTCSRGGMVVGVAAGVEW